MIMNANNDYKAIITRENKLDIYKIFIKAIMNIMLTKNPIYK